MPFLIKLTEHVSSIVLFNLCSTIGHIIKINLGMSEIMRSTKLMLLGISIMIVSLFIQNEEGIRLYGNEIFILAFGFILTLIGFFIKGKINNS